MRHFAVCVLVCIMLWAVLASGQNSSSSSSTGSRVPVKNHTNALSNCNVPPHCLGPLLNSTTINQLYNKTNLQCGQENSRYAKSWLYYDHSTSPPICLNLNMRRKAWFFPTVDYFSVMQLIGSFNTALGTGLNLTWLMYPDFVFRVEAGGFATDWQYVWKQPPLNDPLPDIPYILPFATVIVTVTDGVITGLNWDDGGCLTCGGDQCIGGLDAFGNPTNDRFCGVRLTDCGFNATAPAYYGNFTVPNGVPHLFSDPDNAPEVPGTTDCDLSVYIGWTGTDAKGQFLTSSEETLSRFRSYSIVSAANSAGQTLYQAAPPVPSWGDTNPNLPVPGGSTQQGVDYTPQSLRHSQEQPLQGLVEENALPTMVYGK